LYVANVPLNSVHRFDPVDRSFVDEFIASGYGGLLGPGVMAFGPDGNFYISSGRTNSVLRYRRDTGEFIGALASVDGLGVEGPVDLVFGPDGNMYVGARGFANGSQGLGAHGN
jgi:DNA-binding beta-propeller fold protein YncE